MKKVISLALAALLCFSLSLSAFADDFVDKPVVQKPVVSGTVDVSVPSSNKDLSEFYEQVLDWAHQRREYLDDTINAELAYFFTVLLNDSYEVSTGTYKLPDGTTVSGTAYRPRATHFNGLVNEVLNMFDPDYLHAYFDIFKRCLNDYDGADFMESAVGFRYAPNTNAALCFTSSSYPASYDFEGFSDYYNTLYAKYLEENGSSGISVGYENENPEKYVQPIKIPAEDFKGYIEKSNEEYSPKSTGKYISYRTDEWYGKNGESYCLLPLYNGGFCGERWNEVYLMPFYTDGEDRYYSEYQLHFYLERVDNESGDGWTTTFAVDWFSNFDDIDEKKGTKIIKEGMTSPEYVVLSSTPDGYNRFFMFMYPSLSQLLERPHSGSCSKTFYGPDTFRYYKSGDLSAFVTSNLFNHFYSSYSGHDSSCLYGSADDIGYYYSNTPIMFSYSNIDTEKIPDSYYITVNGDTIYDYSITNPDTGQSSTINEYITNNYTYITNNNPSGDGSGSGTTGGNVTVGGNIGVNGNVNVGGEVKVGVDVSPIDINVNVSGNGGAGESGGEPPEIGGLDDLVGYLPEKSPAISQYLKIFFDTLPPELMALILAGVAVAVIKLIFRR